MNAVTKMEGQAPQLPADPMVSMIERVMMNPDLPMERITAMMDMRERQMNKEAEQAFNRDFAAAMAEMPPIPKSGTNKHTGNKYSELKDLVNTTRPVLSRHNLALNWTSSTKGNEVEVTAIVRHGLGHQITTTLIGPKDSGKQMNAIQGGGSTSTYLKRYTGFDILGLASGDEVEDDGASSGMAHPISVEQFDTLRELIDGAGITEEIVCTAERLSALHELPAADLTGCQRVYFGAAGDKVWWRLDTIMDGADSVSFAYLPDEVAAMVGDHDASIAALEAQLAEAQARPTVQEAARVKPLDLSNLLRHAFIEGFIACEESTDGCGQEFWPDYDPTECSAYGRICAALRAIGEGKA
ncbi:ERF family protein [Sagittula sp. S175]|uniref:ERF family protein n=1 Tax=Sagittula sp. S175 TaxID=3415129 RepID=UPI003C7D5B4F